MREISIAIAAALTAGLAALALTGAVGAVEDESDGASEVRDPDYAAGRDALARKQWEEAAQRFASVALRQPDSADVHNLLGYAYRQSSQLDLALQEYRRALAIDPRHKGAHEYIGETYLKLGDLAAAQRHLATLRRLCPLPCEPLRDLEQAVETYIKTHRASALPAASDGPR